MNYNYMIETEDFDYMIKFRLGEVFKFQEENYEYEYEIKHLKCHNEIKDIEDKINNNLKNIMKLEHDMQCINRTKNIILNMKVPHEETFLSAIDLIPNVNFKKYKEESESESEIETESEDEEVEEIKKVKTKGHYKKQCKKQCKNCMKYISIRWKKCPECEQICTLG